MDKKKYASALIDALSTARMAKMFAIAMLVSNLILAITIMRADTSEKTIVVPPDLEKPFSVHGNRVSPEYIEQISKYFSQLLLTYHKQTAQSQFDTVLRYADPASYSELKTKFMLDLDRISRNDIRSVFYLMSIHIEGQTATLTGELNGFVGRNLISSSPKTFQFRFKYDGNLTILGFNELRKNHIGETTVVDNLDDSLYGENEAANE